MEENPANDCLDEAGTLVLIQEVNEVEAEEVLMVPEENEGPILMREQPPSYCPVHGQQAVCGRGQTQPFHRHLFPYTVDQDQGSCPTVGIWLFDATKHRRSDKSGGDEDRPSPK